MAYYMSFSVNITSRNSEKQRIYKINNEIRLLGRYNATKRKKQTIKHCKKPFRNRITT